jgi:hypothetical protein
VLLLPSHFELLLLAVAETGRLGSRYLATASESNRLRRLSVSYVISKM